AADRSLLRVTWNHRFAQGASGLLRPALWRETEPRDPGRGDAGLKGRFCQRGAGDHRARRCGAVPESELPDSRLWIPDGRWRDPIGTLGADAAILRGGRA